MMPWECACPGATHDRSTVNDHLHELAATRARYRRLTRDLARDVPLVGRRDGATVLRSLRYTISYDRRMLRQHGVAIPPTR